MELVTSSVNKQQLFRHRVYAFTFDMFMVGLTSKLVMFTYTSFLRTFFHQLRFQVQDTLAKGVPLIHLSVLMAVFFSYFFISYYTSEGKTLGKMMFGLRVYSPTHPRTALTLSESFKRTMGYLVCYVTGLFLFALPLVRSDRRGLPDFFSNTEVTFEDHFNSELLPQSERDQNERDQLDLFDTAA